MAKERTALQQQLRELSTTDLEAMAGEITNVTPRKHTLVSCATALQVGVEVDIELLRRRRVAMLTKNNIPYDDDGWPIKTPEADDETDKDKSGN